jgi:DNA replication protein DnaC
MKKISDMATAYLPNREAGIMVDAIQDMFVLKYLDTPVLSETVVCPMCGGSNGYCCLIEPRVSNKRMWFCSEGDCLTKVELSRTTQCQSTKQRQRAIQWPLFCQENGLGDKDYDISFDKVDQSLQKIQFLVKFSQKPEGIIVMEGPKGTGKTYAALGLCELFTRTNSSCFFYTYDRLITEWLEGGQIKKNLTVANLVVIDDFGTAEPSKAFLQFFMGVIDERMRWHERGTVITTNLDEKKLGDFCGEYLGDRLNTGQHFLVTGGSRRKKLVL